MSGGGGGGVWGEDWGAWEEVGWVGVWGGGQAYKGRGLFSSSTFRMFLCWVKEKFMFIFLITWGWGGVGVGWGAWEEAGSVGVGGWGDGEGVRPRKAGDCFLLLLFVCSCVKESLCLSS